MFLIAQQLYQPHAFATAAASFFTMECFEQDAISKNLFIFVSMFV